MNKLLTKKLNFFIIIYLDHIFIHIQNLGQYYLKII